ncbi:MAG: HAMP domain-containing histidine kinase [Oscillospiraceae bacterium]|nr:HAMP domain-containing histidine kinase [Oscillospiraceae bacterium]
MLINVISLTVVLLVIFISMYFSIKSQLLKQEESLLNRGVALSDSENTQVPGYIKNNDDKSYTILDSNEELLASLFYVKVDVMGAITAVSDNIIQNKDNLMLLLQKVDDLDKSTGDVDLFDLKLSFLVEDRLDGKIYAFIDRADRESTMSRYMYTAVFLLVGAVACVFLISMFLAGKAIKPIRESMEKQKKFVADASHELRTPIAVIRSNAEMIMDSPEMTIEENMKWLKYIYDESKRMGKMTEDLLLLSHADAKNEVPKEDIDLSRLAADTYDSFKLLLEENKLTDGKAEITEGVHVYANEFSMKQLITILLDNAMKYTKEGGISVRLEKDDNFAYMYIKDTGVGIPADMKEKIFERFFRIDKSRAKTAATGGLGLGLSIAKVIADEHGGTISVESELEKGSEFCVKLPLMKG